MKIQQLTRLWIALLFSHSALIAQNSAVVKGTIQEAGGAPLAVANVFLLNPTDSSLVRGAITEDDGTFTFEQLEAGSYFISANLVGYTTVNLESFQLDAGQVLRLEPIELSSGVDLSTVNVVARKPLYEQKVDRMVVNVENSIVSAGGTALQILERSPGVIVDRSNNSISLVGKDGVNVMINDKISYMPIASLVQFLEGTSADNIVRIELITTPPANFDAEGNAGYINIVLKKPIDEGLNGSVSLSYGYGRGHVSNDNVNFNFRQRGLNLFGSYSFLLNGQDQVFGNFRDLNLDAGNEIATTDLIRDPNQRNHNARLGMDLELGKKTIFGVLIGGYDNKWTMDAVNTNFTSLNDAPVENIVLDNTERNQWQHFSANVNLKHNLTDRESISFDVDYLSFDNENPTDYENTVTDFTDPNATPSIENIRSDKSTPITIYVGKIDYENKLSDKVSFQAGIKSVISQFDNDVRVETFDDIQWVPDPSLTSFSELREEIFAGYGTFDIQFSEKTSGKVGLRYEYTDSKLNTDTEGRVVDRQFGRFFPTAYIAHQFNEDIGMNLSYSRRITRPTFNEMAPFVYFLDPNTFFAGNTAVQPAFSDAYKIDLRYKTIFFSAQYTVQDSAISRFQQRFDPVTNRVIFITENMVTNKVLSFTLGFPVNVTKWWSMRNNVNYFVAENSLFVDNVLLELAQNFLQMNATQSFKLPAGFSAEVNGFYVGPRVFGTSEQEEIWGINVGFQKTLKDNLGTLRFNINDIFNSIESRGITRLPNDLGVTGSSFDFSQTTFILTYSRSFGNQKVKAARRRAEAEERNRVQG